MRNVTFSINGEEFSLPENEATDLFYSASDSLAMIDVMGAKAARVYFKETVERDLPAAELRKFVTKLGTDLGISYNE